MWVAWTNRAVTDNEGHIVEILSVGNDITRRKLAEDRLKVTLDELAAAKIVEPQDIPSDVVTMNSIVKLSFMNNDRRVQLQIVYPDQANLKNNKISILSPVATALIGYKAGDEIEWVVPAGLTRIRIDEITYQPEAAGDYDL